MSAAALSKIANIGSILTNFPKLGEEIEKGLEDIGGGDQPENDSDDQLDEKPRLSKRQCSHMDNVDMRTNGRYLRNGKCAYDQDTLRNSGNYPEDKRLSRQIRQHHDNDEGMLPFQSSARLARYFSESKLGPFLQRLSGQEVQPPSLAPASLVHAADSAGETPQSLIDSSPATTFDSALGLKGLISGGIQEPTYVAVAPTAISSASPVEGLESFLSGIFEGFALMSPVILIALLWLVIVLKRAKRQRRAARIEHELVGPYPSPMVETKGDVESGSV